MDNLYSVIPNKARMEPQICGPSPAFTDIWTESHALPIREGGICEVYYEGQWLSIKLSAHEAESLQTCQEMLSAILDRVLSSHKWSSWRAKPSSQIGEPSS